MNAAKPFLKNKYLWIAAGSILLLLLGLYLYGSKMLYGNPLFQTWVDDQITTQTNGAFQFKAIRGDIFSADLEDFSLDLKGSSFNVQEAQAPTLKASFGWLPLLQNKLEIRSLTMVGGELKLKLQGGAPQNTTLPVGSSFHLKKGKISLSNLSGWNIQFQDCEANVSQSGTGADHQIFGDISSPQVSVSGLKLENLTAKLSMKGGLLLVEKLTATLPGQSKLELSGSCELAGKRSLKINLSLQSANLKSLLSALDYSNHFAGQAKITLKAEGVFTPASRSLNGAGQADLSAIEPDVIMPKFPAFNDAPIFDRVEKLNDLKGKAAFLLEKEKIVVHELDLKNADLRITGNAKIGYDRSLQSSLVLTGNKRVDQEIPAMVRSVFKHDAEGKVLIPFELEPSTREPKVDVGDVVGKVLSNPAKLLNPLNLFK